MANIDSTTVAGLEAVPSSVANSSTLYGRKRTMVEVISVLAAHNDADTYTVLPVPLEARVDDLLIANAAITGGTDYDFGFYQITDNDLGAAIDADILADGASMASARNSYESIIYTGGSSASRSDAKKAVWELCGYADITAARRANQTGQVYLVVTANTVGSADGDFAVRLDISVD